MMENQSYVAMCPHCQKYQSKRVINWGKKTVNTKCTYCGKAFKINNLKTVDGSVAPEIVAELNIGTKGYRGFKTLEDKI